MKLFSPLKALPWLGFCVICTFSSCSDDPNALGVDLQNPDNLLYVYNSDATPIHTYSVQRSDTLALNPSYLLLGYSVDEKLGSFQNNFMTEVSLSSFGYDFGDSPVADSLVVFLDYTYSYGDTSQTQQITVYELRRELGLNDTALSINGRPMDPEVLKEYYYSETPLTTFSFNPNPADTMPIRFKLPAELAARIMDTNFYTTQDTFSTNVFRGLYFVAEPIGNGGAISYFNVSDSTRMELHYHNDKDTTLFKYNINSYVYRTNIFFREYLPSITYVPVETDPSENNEQELFYLKTNNAFEARIDITGLSAWADSGNFAINKAVLDIYAVEPVTDLDSLYPAFTSIYVYELDSLYAKKYLQEYAGTSEYYKITYSILPDSGYGYHININQTLYNAIQEGRDELSLILTIDDLSTRSVASHSVANRAILKGATHPDNPVKLTITYSKYKTD